MPRRTKPSTTSLTESDSVSYVKALNRIDVSIVDLATKGCRESGSPKFSLAMCLKASLAWHEENVPESEIHAKMVAAGCSEE